MVEEGGDSLLRMGRCTGGSCKMMGEGLLTNRLLPQLPGLAQPCPAPMPQLHNQEDPRSTPPQAVPAPAGDLQNSSPENKEKE